MSYVAVTFHIVWGTYRRQRTICEEYERELYNFIYQFCCKRDVFVRRIGGMPDHVHLLVDVPTTMAISDFVKVLKCESSKVMRRNPHFPIWNGWAEGVAIISVCPECREHKANYIRNQKEHHKVKPFLEELNQLFLEAGLPVDGL